MSTCTDCAGCTSCTDERPGPFQHYIAGVIATGLEFVCHLLNHYPLPCWWTRNRVYSWAASILNPDPRPRNKES